MTWWEKIKDWGARVFIFVTEALGSALEDDPFDDL